MIKFRHMDDFLNWASTYLLTEFMEKGGKGLRGAIMTIIGRYKQYEEKGE